MGQQLNCTAKSGCILRVNSAWASVAQKGMKAVPVAS